MESTTSLIPYLFAVTFVFAIAFGFWQYTRASKAKRDGHRSVDAAVHGDLRSAPDPSKRR